MSQIQFRSLDLNLLRVFDALAEENSVTGAAARLGLTPSAISHALSRLRHILHDDLFVRGARGMNPTPRAIALTIPIRRALLDLQHALDEEAFVPAETDRRFNIACGDYVASILLPELIARFRVLAPRAEIRVTPVNNAMQELDAGRIDVALGGFERIPDRLSTETLFADDMVWAMRSANPVAGEEPTLERLASLPHLIIASGENDRAVRGIVSDAGLERRVIRDEPGAFDQLFAEHGLSRTIAVTVSNPITALAALAESDLAAMLPQQLATAYKERYGLTLWRPPHPTTPFRITAVWHRWHGDQPAVHWLRELIRAVVAESWGDQAMN